ncbi:MAG: hypothetical protein ACJZ8E_04250 [Pseudohongiellaceae bacterium]
MNESQRKVYLSAMGIDVYYPRAILPGAKPSPAYEFDLIEEGQTLPIDSSSVQEEENKAPDTQLEIAENGSAETESIEQEAAVRAGPDAKVDLIEAAQPEQIKEVEESGELRFALRYYRVTDSVAVIDEYPLQQSAHSRDESLHLLRNILRALNIEVEVEVLSPELFSWPLIEGLTEETDSANAAKQALQGFIAGRQEQDGFKNLIVFVGVIDDLLVGPERAENCRDYQIENSDTFITITQSLQSMLSFPDLKKDAWHQLQPVLLRIQSTN